MPARPLLAIILVPLVAIGSAMAAPDLTPDEARARVQYHLDHVQTLSTQLEASVQGSCPHFDGRAQWDAYIDDEVGQIALLVAHLDEAWVEAKRTGDDDVRRLAKAPRRRLEARTDLIDKLQHCAEANGVVLDVGALWRRVEEDAAARQPEIALPR